MTKSAVYNLASVSLQWNISDYFYQNQEKLRVSLTSDNQVFPDFPGVPNMPPFDKLWMCLYARLGEYRIMLSKFVIHFAHLEVPEGLDKGDSTFKCLLVNYVLFVRFTFIAWPSWQPSEGWLRHKYPIFSSYTHSGLILFMKLFTLFHPGDLCVDSRPAVRKSAGQTLFSTIAAHGALLHNQTWQAVLWQVNTL